MAIMGIMVNKLCRPGNNKIAHIARFADIASGWRDPRRGVRRNPEFSGKIARRLAFRGPLSKIVF
jgi:hypothetical protein